MPQYKLIYFDCAARAEPIRLLFHAAEKEFDDVRVSKEDWAAGMKAKSPMGCLPILEVDGKQLCQSTAIARYLAKTFSLAGKTKSDAAKCDMYVEWAMEIFSAVTMYDEYLLQNPEERERAYNKALMEKLVPFMDQCEKFLKKNATGYFVGKEMTWADIMIYATLAGLQKRGHESLLDNHPILAANLESIYQRPGIKAYVDQWKTQAKTEQEVEED